MKDSPQKRHHYTQAKQLDSLVHIGWGGDEPEKGYLARMLFHTMLPHSAQEAREWMRRNGNIRLYMQSGAGMGLPYGSYPRLVFAWVVTEAYKTKSRRLVLGDSLSDFMRQLGLIPTGGRWGTITQLREQIERLFAARIMAYRDDAEKRGRGGQAMQVANRWELWWDSKSPDQSAIWDNEVILGEDFYSEIVNFPFPFDMRILRAVKRSPLGIDLYTWLTYRVSYLKEPVYIPWKDLYAQFGTEYDSVYEFARKAKRELVKIKAAWSGLAYETPRGRLCLHPSPPSVPQLIKG